MMKRRSQATLGDATTMTKCFLCKKHFTTTESHAVAWLLKCEELRFNKKKTIIASICLDCIGNPEVIKFKKVIIDKEWSYPQRERATQ